MGDFIFLSHNSDSTARIPKMNAFIFHITQNILMRVCFFVLMLLYYLSIGNLYASQDLKELCQLSENSDSKAFKTSKFPIQDDSGNQVLLSAEFDIVRYFSITCGSSQREVLIEFKDKKRNRSISKGSIVVYGKQKFGNRFYWEIGTAVGENFAAVRAGAPTQSKVTLSRNGSVDPNQYDNPNLMFFKSLARDPNRRKESKTDLVLFFDHTCPLVFQSKDQSFYWDQSIAYRFEISCTRDSPYGSIRVPGNKNGELTVSGTIAQNVKTGDRFFAKVRLTKITDEQAFWGDFQLYYE